MHRVALLLLVFLLLPAAPGEGAGREPEFWPWFQANEARIREAFERREAAPEALQAMTLEIAEAFRRVEPNLVFEYGKAEDGVYEFVVSAEGLRESIPRVLATVESAPPVAGWRFIAFRPRNPDFRDVAVSIGGVEIGPESIWYRMAPAGGQVDLVIALQGFDAGNDGPLTQVAFILLDQALGEYDVMTKIRYIDFEALPSDPQRHDLKPLSEIRGDFDAVFPRTRQ